MSVDIIGLYDGHSCGAAHLRDGKVIFASAEERYSRIKMHDGRLFIEKHGLAMRSLRAAVKSLNGKKPACVAIALERPHTVQGIVWSDLWREKNWRWTFFWIGNWNKFGPLEYVSAFIYGWVRTFSIYYMLYQVGLLSVPRAWIPHHEAHAAGAYYFSGKNEVTVCTLDGKGDGLAGSIYIGRNGLMTKVLDVSKYHSIGYLYSIITVGLGYKKTRHEGKITGLAAYGDRNGAVYQAMRKLFSYTPLKLRFSEAEKTFQPPYPDFMNHKKMWDVIASHLPENRSKEDVAAAVQRIAEEDCSSFVRDAVKKTGISYVALSGGVFANVRINEEVARLPEVSGVFVLPAMGDDGLAVGAALVALAEKNHGLTPARPSNYYFGEDYTDDDIKRALDKSGVKYVRHENVEQEIAKLLYAGKVVARCNGRMEWGPRALGNRSILYQAGDKTVNDWLNKRLKRTEFMPFAPVTLAEEADRCYEPIVDANGKKKDYELTDMTMTVQCKPFMKETCPAVVHVDNTARPQLITREINESYYKILSEYHKLSGIPTLINTSFNMHEEPIVMTPDDAIRSFLNGNLDYLALGNYVVEFKG